MTRCSIVFDPPLSKVDFDAIPWKSVLVECPTKEASAFALVFQKEARSESGKGNEAGSRAFQLLAQVCSMLLTDDESGEAFRPLIGSPGGGSAAPNDFSPEELSVLDELRKETDDPEFGARVADVLWVRKRAHTAALDAIDAYLVSARRLESPENWPPCHQRLRRAVHLAASLGKGGADRFEKAVAQIEEILDRHRGTDPLFLSASLMEVLQEQERGDANKFAAYAEVAALRAETERNWHKARTYWQTTACWHALAGDQARETSARSHFAETFVHEAEAEMAKGTPSALRAGGLLGFAIEAYRRISGGKSHADQLKRRMEDLQVLGLAELRPIEAKFDTASFAEQAEKEVSEKEFLDSLFALATMGRSPSRKRLREDAERLARAAPFSSLFPLAKVESHGRVVSRRPSIDPTRPEESEEGIEAEMLQHAGLFRAAHVRTTIDPARRRILQEHHFIDAELIPLVRSNPFVPTGREGIFARGLGAGLRGDLLVAVHLLVPQLENSIRTILRENGAQTTSLSSDGIQKEKNLNDLFTLTEMADTFGEDLTFDLLGLLAEDWGANLRNRIAHGLLSHGDCYSEDAMYAWWLTLRLCCIPLLAAPRAKDRSEEKDSLPEAPLSSRDG